MHSQLFLVKSEISTIELVDVLSKTGAPDILVTILSSLESIFTDSLCKLVFKDSFLSLSTLKSDTILDSGFIVFPLVHDNCKNTATTKITTTTIICAFLFIINHSSSYLWVS